MTPRPQNRVRVALVGVLALLVAALVIPSVSAQFPRQPFPGGGPGMQPRVPEAPRMPEVPRPNFPQPNFPQPQMPEVPRPGDRFGGAIERVWTCGKCGKEIGRGAFPPNTCQHCGVRIINGMGGGDRPAQNDNNGGFNAPGNQPGLQPQPRPGMGIQPQPGGDFRAEGFDPPPPVNQNPANQDNWIAPATPLTSDKVESSSSSGVFWTVLGIVFGLGVLLIIGLVLFAILSQGGKKKARRKPKRSTTRKQYDDDDDDDEYIPRSKRRRYDD